MRRVLALVASVVLALQFSAVFLAVPVRSDETGPCIGDGVSGKRIHLWYAWHTADRYSVDVTTIRRIVEAADARLAVIGGQHYRFLCSGGVIVVDKIHIASPGLDSFKEALRARGYTSPDRIYNAFQPQLEIGRADTTTDDRPDPSVNIANTGPRYSTQSFNVESFMHETGHNLGAVQRSAPHSSGRSHCWDENDVMCYDDGGPYFQNGGELQTLCGGGIVGGPIHWDCNLDDYYNPNPLVGSYLATHWNIRDSYFLTPVPTSPPAPLNLHMTESTPASITMAWDAVSDPDGVSAYSLELRRSDVGNYAVACETSERSCTATGLSLLLGPSFQFRVRARDGAGTWGAYSAVVPASCTTPVCI